MMNSLRLKFITFAVAVFALCTTAFAGSLDYLSNQSGKFFMTMAREAATDSADIVNFNPAGTAFMKEGTYIDVSSQTFFKFYKNNDVKVPDWDFEKSYKSTKPSLFVPNAYIVHNFGQVGSGKLALFGGVGAPAGGGTVKWKDGTAGIIALATGIGQTGGSTLKKSKVDLTGYSVYYGISAGTAYSFLNDMVSLSAGVRYNYGDRWGKIKGSLDYDRAGIGAWSLDVNSHYKYTAKGFTPIFGLDLRPVKGLTLGFRYEMETEMNFKYKQKKLDVSASNPAFNTLATGVKKELDNDGKKMNRNLPHMIAFATEYEVTPKFTVSTGVRAWLMSKTDLEGEEKYYKTGYEFSLGLAYQVLEKLKLATAGMYTIQGIKDGYYGDIKYVAGLCPNPTIDSFTFGVGTVYSLSEKLDAYFAIAWAEYFDEEVKTTVRNKSNSSTNDMEYTYDKGVCNIGMGISYKI